MMTVMLAISLLNVCNSEAFERVHHQRDILQVFSNSQNSSSDVSRSNGSLATSVPSALRPSPSVNRNSSLLAPAPHNLGPGVGRGNSSQAASQPVAAPAYGVFRQIAGPFRASPPAPVPPSNSSSGALQVPDSGQSHRLSNAVIIVISLAAALAVSAVVASAIQLARRRKQRRALLVQRENTISKPGTGRQRPVLETFDSKSPLSGAHSAEESRSEQTRDCQNVVPSFQRHKKSIYIPSFLAKKFQAHWGSSLGDPEQARISASHFNSTYDDIGQIEMQLQGAVPMEIDEFENIDLNNEEAQKKDIGEEMEYETSASPEAQSSSSHDNEAQSAERRRSSVSSAQSDLIRTHRNQDDHGSARRALTEWQVQDLSPRYTLSGDRSFRGSTSSSLAEQEIEPSEIHFCLRRDGSHWKLGEGGFGSVYKALRGGVTEVAVKVLNEATKMDVKSFRQEASILAACRDVHICQFLGACFRPDAAMIVTEYCPEGDLRSKLSSYEGEKYQWKNLGRKIALDVSAGLAYLHSRKIIHFDLKGSNIMVVHGDSAKITDVGLASVMSNADYVSKLEHTGTFAYAAPELLTGKKCTVAADMFSFGVLLYEIVTGDIPKRGCMRDIRIPEEASTQQVEAFITACIHENPKLRPTAKQAFDILRTLP